MLKWMRGKRFDLKTSLIVLIVALIAWAFVIYANLAEFVPDELQEPREQPTRSP